MVYQVYVYYRQNMVYTSVIVARVHGPYNLPRIQKFSMVISPLSLALSTRYTATSKCKHRLPRLVFPSFGFSLVLSSFFLGVVGSWSSCYLLHVEGWKNSGRLHFSRTRRKHKQPSLPRACLNIVVGSQACGWEFIFFVFCPSHILSSHFSFLSLPP